MKKGMNFAIALGFSALAFLIFIIMNKNYLETIGGAIVIACTFLSLGLLATFFWEDFIREIAEKKCSINKVVLFVIYMILVSALEIVVAPILSSVLLLLVIVTVVVSFFEGK